MCSVGQQKTNKPISWSEIEINQFDCIMDRKNISIYWILTLIKVCRFNWKKIPASNPKGLMVRSIKSDIAFFSDWLHSNHLERNALCGSNALLSIARVPAKFGLNICKSIPQVYPPRNANWIFVNCWACEWTGYWMRCYTRTSQRSTYLCKLISADANDRCTYSQLNE